jgi:DNA-binding XRE family transcriptional regulator
MFKRWYKSQGYETQAACAKALGLHKSTISRMLNDPEYTPDRFTALHIERVTKKAVPADSWKERA